MKGRVVALRQLKSSAPAGPRVSPAQAARNVLRQALSSRHAADVGRERAFGLNEGSEANVGATTLATWMAIRARQRSCAFTCAQACVLRGDAACIVKQHARTSGVGRTDRQAGAKSVQAVHSHGRGTREPTG